MKQMKHKRYWLIVFTAIIITGLSIRYTTLNKNVPGEYTIQYSKVGDIVACDDLNLKVISVQKSNEKNKNKFVTVSLEVKNTSKKPINAMLLIESPLGIGNKKIETDPKNNDKSGLNRIEPGKSISTSLKYKINSKMKTSKQEDMTLYLPIELYKTDVIQEYKKGIRLGKAINM